MAFGAFVWGILVNYLTEEVLFKYTVLFITYTKKSNQSRNALIGLF